MNETQLTERLSDTAKRQAFSITVLSVCGDADQGLCDAAAQIVSKVSKAGSAQVAADGGGSSVRQGEIEETLSMLRLELMRSAGPKSQEARKRTGDGCRALAERSQSFPPS